MQGSKAIVWITGVHTGVVVALFFALLWNGLLSLQLFEDGRMGSLAPFAAGVVLLTVGASFIAIALGFNSPTTFFASSNPARLHSAWLFSLTIVWPAVAACAYLVIQLAVIVRVLQETRPIGASSLPSLPLTRQCSSSQPPASSLSPRAHASRYRIASASAPTCVACMSRRLIAQAKVDGSFLATLLETATVGIIFKACAFVSAALC